MAKKDTNKVEIERTYNVPLRKEFMKVPRWKKTQKAVTTLRQFLSKHMKSDNVKLGKEVNKELWKHGIRNPPHHIKVNVTKDSKGVVKAELFGAKKETGNKVSGGSKEPSKKVEKEVKKEESKAEEKKETAKEKENKSEAKQEQETLQKDTPKVMEEKLPKAKDEKATQSVPSQKNQLN